MNISKEAAQEVLKFMEQHGDFGELLVDDLTRNLRTILARYEVWALSTPHNMEHIRSNVVSKWDDLLPAVMDMEKQRRHQTDTYGPGFERWLHYIRKVS